MGYVAARVKLTVSPLQYWQMNLHEKKKPAMRQTANTIVVFVVTFVLALIAACFSATAADTVWNALAAIADEVVVYLPPARSIVAPLILLSYVLLPVFFAIGAAFFVTFSLLTLLRRFLIIHLDRLLVRIGIATGYAGLSPVVLLASVLILGVYACIAFPSPAPYPGATVKVVFRDLGHQGYNKITYEYTVEAPLHKVEEHYIAEMEKLCLEGWEFVDTDIACTDFVKCRASECEISRPLARLARGAQSFSVYLRVASETETNVLYFEKTRDLAESPSATSPSLARANTRWRRQRLSALFGSRPFGFVARLVQSGGSAHPALRLSYTVSPPSLVARWTRQGNAVFGLVVVALR